MTLVNLGVLSCAIPKDKKVRKLFKLIRHIRTTNPPTKALKGIRKQKSEEAMENPEEESMEEEGGEESELEDDIVVTDGECEPTPAKKTKLCPAKVPKISGKGSSSASSTPRAPMPTTRQKGKSSPDKDAVLFMGITESAKAVQMREALKEVKAQIEALKLQKWHP